MLPQKEAVIMDIREYVVSEGEAFATGSTTQVRLLMRDYFQAQQMSFPHL